MKICIRLLFLCLLSFVAQSHEPQEVTESRTYVFVHGAWGGGWDYKHMALLLEEKGHQVYRVTLTGLGEKAHLNSPNINLETHIMDVVNLFKYEQIEKAVLIGHSYGGMVITGAADRIAENISHIVYADALLPENGESVFDLFPDSRESSIQSAKEKGEGWKLLPTWQDWGLDVPHPLATFEQKITLENPKLGQVSATYILTIEPDADVDAFSPFAARAKKRGWPVIEFKTGHNLQRTMPNEYAEVLLGLAKG